MSPTSIELEKSVGMLYYITSTEGLGGRIKCRLDDFIVVEDSDIPFNPEGEHLVLVIEKRGVTTDFVVKHISMVSGLDRRLIGFSGVKDSRAVAVQKFSIPIKGEVDVRKFNVEGRVRVLDAYRTSRKIRVGALKGNFFEITLRECNFRGELAEVTLRELEDFGCPNYFGHQRFGTIRFNTHMLGKRLLQEDYESFFEELLYKVYPEESDSAKESRVLAGEGYLREAYERMPKKLWVERRAIKMMMEGLPLQKVARLLGLSLIKFYVNAYQSYLFNLMLSERISCSMPLNRPVEGDFLKGGSPAFPLLGFKSKIPGGDAGKIVRSVLEREGLELKSFRNRSLGLKVKGSLRKLQLNYRNMKYASSGEGSAKFSFWLEKGCYATTLLREFCKNEFYR